MGIYTKTGDKGTTALFGGKRVSKYNPQVEAYGAIDEVTCFIGFAIESLTDKEIKSFLTEIQLDLYSIMAYLSGGPFKSDISKKHIIDMEKLIDSLEKELPKLTRFVLPQGSESTARMHLARAVVRSTERRIVEFIESKESQSSNDLLAIKYVNRLSDFLFMLARKYNTSEKLT